MVDSIIICRHGDSGFSASLRFKNSKYDVELSASNKYSLYKNIEYVVMKVQKNEG